MADGGSEGEGDAALAEAAAAATGAAGGGRPWQERILLAIVVGLGLAIVGGLGAVVWRITYLSSHPEAAVTVTPAALTVVKVPAGASLKLIATDQGRVIVTYEEAGGTNVVTVIDAATGRVMSEVRVERGR